MASLTQIAKKAGVSVTAASLVLNKKDHGTRVSADCAKKIRAIAKELGYVPNYHASSIKKGRSETVALAFDIGWATADGRNIVARGEMAQPYFGLLIGGVEEVMRSRGMLLTLVGPDLKHRAPDRALIGMKQRRFDGMIILGTLLHLDETTILQDAPELPVVVTEPTAATELPCVDYDEVKAVSLAVDHLAELGHKRLLWVGPSEDYPLPQTRPHRPTLFATRCNELGIATEALDFRHVSPEGFEHYQSQPDAAREAMAAYLKSKPRSFTGIVCYNDNCATGVMDALADAGLDVPKDVSVVGHDDVEGRRCRPKLTSVDHRLEEMGKRSAELLMQMIENPERIADLRGTREMIQPRLMVRGSTGKAAS